METNNKLLTDINEFIEERLQESYKKILHKDKYKEILKNYYNLFHKVEAIVNNAKITDDYKEAEIDAYTIQLKEAYKIGFYDSAAIFINKNDNV